ncbi:MAG: hypothetical protein K6U87_08260 [Firmicutes bacterium]|nr:hypothetical protein [Bacillota bacterium]
MGADADAVGAIRRITERMAAKSTTAGTPVKSCNTTRAGLKGISRLGTPSFRQDARARTSSSVIW